MDEFLKTWKPGTGQLHIYIRHNGRHEVLWQHPCRVVRVSRERVLIVTTDEVGNVYESKVKPTNLRVADFEADRYLLKPEIVEAIRGHRVLGSWR